MAHKSLFRRIKTLFIISLFLVSTHSSGMQRPSSHVGFSKPCIEKNLDEFSLCRAQLQPEKQQRLNEFFMQHGITSDLIGTQEFEERLQTAGFTILRGLTHGNGKDETVVALFPDVLKATIGDFVLKANASRQMLEKHASLNLTRVIMAQKVAQHIAAKPSSDIRVPRKFMHYLAPSELQRMNPTKRPTWYSDGNYIVLADRVDIDESRSILQATTEQLAQVLDIIMTFGLCDLNLVANTTNCNIVFDRAGKIVFIDTPCQAEMYSTFNLMHAKHFALFNFSVGRPYEYMLTNLMHNPQDKILLRSWIFVLNMGLLPFYRHYKNTTFDHDKIALIEHKIHECYERIEETVGRVLSGNTIQAVWPQIQQQVPNTEIEDIPYISLKAYLHLEGIDF